MAPVVGTPACPACGAATRPGAPWCTQCFLDLRAPARAASVPPPRLPSPPPPVPPAVGQDDPADEACWPCGTCGAQVPLALRSCPACGAGFLAELTAGEPPLLVLPGVGDLTRLPRAQRLAIAFGLVLAVLAALLLAGWLLGGR